MSYYSDLKFLIETPESHHGPNKPNHIDQVIHPQQREENCQRGRRFECHNHTMDQWPISTIPFQPQTSNIATASESDDTSSSSSNWMTGFSSWRSAGSTSPESPAGLLEQLHTHPFSYLLESFWLTDNERGLLDDLLEQALRAESPPTENPLSNKSRSRSGSLLARTDNLDSDTSGRQSGFCSPSSHGEPISPQSLGGSLSTIDVDTYLEIREEGERELEGRIVIPVLDDIDLENWF